MATHRGVSEEEIIIEMIVEVSLCYVHVGRLSFVLHELMFCAGCTVADEKLLRRTVVFCKHCSAK